MLFNGRIDLHMHTRVSDGTDTPEEIIGRVKAANILLFAISDHDAIEGCKRVKNVLKKGDPAFIYGVEFSCKDEEGQYHILGYGYDETAPSINEVVELGHGFRVSKLNKRLDFLEKEYGFTFKNEDKEWLFSLSNPGKPHIGNLMVKYGYAPSKEVAIEEYLDKFVSKTEYVRPEQAIEGILNAGGIPVLAHPSYGRGDALIIGTEMENRVKRLVRMGIKGLEAFYSGFTPPLQKEILALAERYDLYVTAGSDYHGGNKLVMLGDTNLDTVKEYPKGLERFLSDVKIVYND